jgi:RNA polymerase sigma-70 factor (ECF subfamily)
MTAVEFQHKLVSLESNLERFAYSLTLNREDAKDLLQETFLKALTYRDKFTHNDNFKAWAYTIMKNTFINNYRRNIRQNTHRDQTKEGYFLNQPKAMGFDDPDSAFSTKELTRNVEQLDDEFRIPFKMHHEGFKYKEIADELNLNIGTVKSRIFFSRKKLMERLQDYAA